MNPEVNRLQPLSEEQVQELLTWMEQAQDNNIGMALALNSDSQVIGVVGDYDAQEEQPIHELNGHACSPQAPAGPEPVSGPAASRSA